MTYRAITIGEALTDSLKEFDQQINEELQEKILKSYDQILEQKFNELNTQTKVRLAGRSRRYNHVDDVWVFYLDECELKGEGIVEKSKNCKIVAIEAQSKEGGHIKQPVKKGRKNTRPRRS